MKKSILIILLFSIKQLNAQIITTIAGTGYQGLSCDGGNGGLATAATMGQPNSVCVDAGGNIYIADVYYTCIRKINGLTGIISTYADGFNNPTGICVDAAGNIYVADYSAYKVKKVNASTGIITTVAGTGSYGYSGDGGPAVNAVMKEVTAVCVDNAGNIYLAETSNHCIRKVDVSTGIITRVAGNPYGLQSYAGDGGLATDAKILPYGVAVDAVGNIYIADAYCRIRKVDVVTGIINTIAGNGVNAYSGDGGPAISASFYPLGIFLDPSTNIYFPDGTHIRKIDATTGIINTIAGNGSTAGTGDGGPPLNAGVVAASVWVDTNQNIYISDAGGNHRVRKVTMAAGIDNLFKNQEFEIYPNPFTSETNINFSEEQTHTIIKIMDVLGKEIKTISFTGKQLIIEKGEMKEGIYFVQVKTEKGAVNRKIVIQ